MVKILPSILAADFSNLGAEIKATEAAGADLHHVDVMDGHFVPNISFGPIVIKDVANVATQPLDIHLMISDPGYYLDEYLAFKPELLTIHAEIEGNISEILQKIRKAGIKAGLSVKPATTLEDVKTYLPDVDVLLIMSVEPGFGGQKFIPESLEKITTFKKYFEIHNLDILLEVDGGVNDQNAAACVAAGADWLVAGSSVFSGNVMEYAVNIKKLKRG